MNAMDLEDTKLMKRELEHKAEQDRIIESLRFGNIRASYKIPHRCLVCNHLMHYNPYIKKLSYIRTMHNDCARALRKFKKQKKHKLSKYLKIMEIEVRSLQ